MIDYNDSADSSFLAGDDLPATFGNSSLQYINLGSIGLKVSRICLGCMTSWREWVLGEEESRPYTRRALEVGITFFDTADVYSQGACEEILGSALKESGPEREHLVIAIRVHSAMGSDPNERGLSRKHIMQAIDASLRKDYVETDEERELDARGENGVKIHGRLLIPRPSHIISMTRSPPSTSSFHRGTPRLSRNPRFRMR